MSGINPQTKTTSAKADLYGKSRTKLSMKIKTLAIGKGKIRHASNVISNNIGYVSGTARGIAFDSIGTMWVADAYSSSHSIKRFSIDISAGQPPPINILYGNGTTINTLNFNNPGAIVICNSDGTNTMYICDTGNHRIVRITSIAILDYAPTQSQYLQVTYIGSYGSAEGNFINPSGIATDAVGNFYVADLSNHRIQKFSHTGSYLSKFGLYGTAEGYFTNPIGIAIDVSGNIWVSDQHRIQIFNNAGTYLRKIGSSSYGSANEQFNTPHSIAFDKAGYVYIADYGNACIKQFTIGGTYVSKFGNNNNYTYLTIYKNKLYASYANNNSVTVFSLPNTSVSVYTCPDDMWSKNGNNFSASAGLSLMGSVAISESLYPFGIGIMKTPAWPEGYAILVVEQGNNWVRFRSIDPAYGGYALTTGGSGSGAGQFNEPIGIAVHQTNHSSRIYVADTGNSRIQIWGTSTTNPTNPAYTPAYISSFGSFGYGDGNFVYPYCVAIHPVSGNVYVSDSTNRVQIFYPNGGYMNQFGGSNDSNPFNNPYGMAFDASGNILVVERNNNRVQKRTSTGTFISQFGSQGTGNGQFNSPHGIAIDENGYIYVGDFGNYRIQVFTSEGVYVNHVGTYGSGNGQFNGVGGITIYNGILYAVDRGGKRIHLYSTSKTTYSGDTWTKLGNDINLYDNVNDSSLTGPTVSLSGDGRCVAIGVNTHDGAAGTVADCGAVSVYKYSVPDMLVTNGNWAQLGDTLYGDAAGDMLGTSVAISTDGTIVAAGAPFNDGGSGTATDNRGKVIVRIYNSDTNAWTATSISGATGDYAGNTIALSSSGTAIAVGTNHSVAGSNWVKAYNLAQTDPIIYTSGNSAVAEVYGQIALSNSQGDAVITVTQTGGISSATMNSRLPVPTIFVNSTRTVIGGYNKGFGYYSDNNFSTYGQIDYKLYHIIDIACDGTRWVAVGYSSNSAIDPSCMSYSDDGINWIVSGTFANFQGGQVYEVKFNGTIWIATGNTIYYSYNGINWTAVPSNPMSSYGALAYNGNRWVTGAYGGYMAYSDNGINWTALGRKFGEIGNIQLYGLASNGSRWIAVGYGPNPIMYSNDGIEWYPVASSVEIFYSGYDVAYNPNSKRWVAVGAAGTWENKNTIAYSDDNGLTWIGLGRIFTESGRKIIWNKAISLWMAIGDCRSSYSGNGTYEGSCRETVVYSSDGIVWTRSIPPIYTAGSALTTNAICSAQPHITYANINNHRVVMCGDGENTLSYSDDGGFAWKGLGKSIFSTTGWGVAFNPSLRRWIAVGEGTNSLAYSSDGINWVPIASNFNIFSSYGRSVACNAAGTRWVAVGSGINSIAYSNDGIGWTGVGTSIFSDSGVSVACNPAGTRWIAVGYGTNRIAYSDNGIAWTGVTGSTTLFTTAVMDVACNADGTMWVAVGSGTNAIATSTDNGVTWTGRGSATFNVTTGLYGIHHNGSYWVAVGPNMWGSSVDGITWWSSTANFFSNNNNNGSGGKVKWIKSLSKWLAVGSGNSNIAYSYDGYGFTSSSCDVISTNCNGFAVWEEFKPIVAVGSGTNSIAYSYDGAAWTGLGTSVFSTAGYDAAWNGTRWVAVGAGTNSIAHSADGGLTWTGLGTSIFSTAGNGIACNETDGTQWVAVGSGTTNSIAYSTDGIAWTGLGKDIFSGVGNGVGYNRNGNQWVAVGSGTNSIACSENIVTWTGLGTSIFTSSGNKVESNGNRWVAVGQGTNSIAYSNDGFVWYGLGTSIFSTAGYGVAWSGTQWVAVGQGTNSIAYSSNGITWTGIGTSIFSTAGYNVAWTGSRWVAVGEGTNRIAYSSDGIAWTPVASSSSIFSTAGFGVQFPLTVNHIIRKVGDSAVSLSGLIMSKSPGAITYTISSGSNLAILRGSDVAFTGAGTVVIVATQAATNMYAAASKTIVMSIIESGGGVELGSNGVTVRYTGTTLPAEPTYVLADPRNTGTKEMFAIVSNTSKSMITDYAEKLGATLVTLSTIGTYGTTGNGNFQYPRGIAIDASGNIYVVDTNNHRVQVFTSAGTYVRQLGTTGTGPGQFNNPYGIAIDASGNIYVVDTNNNRIQVFTSAGTYVSQFGTYGTTGNGQFNYPRGIAIDASGNIYVVDTNNHRVQKFSRTGTYISQLGTGTSSSAANGQFNNPSGITIDASGNIYVLDTYNHRIQVFTSAGTYVSKFGRNGTGNNGQFNYPRGIAIDASGKIIVADTDNHRIQIVGPTPDGYFIGRSYFIPPRQSAAVPFNNIVTTLMTNMSNMFYNAHRFNEPVGSWDTSNVTDISYMFVNASAFNQAIGNWNTAKVTAMTYMFNSTVAFNQAIGTWNTINVTNMEAVFAGASAFNQPIDSWNTAKVTNMGAMFNNATAFNQPLNTWNTINVTSMNYMFQGATAFNGSIGNWNTSNVTNMSQMFASAQAFNQAIGNWNTGNVTSMYGTFSTAQAFNQPLNSWNTSKVRDMYDMFFNATNFNQTLNSWNVSNVTQMRAMFFIATNFNGAIGSWNTINVKNMTLMFCNAPNFNQYIGNWNTSNVTSMVSMFQYASSYNQAMYWWSMSSMYDLSNMFYYATSFNQNLTQWNVQYVTYYYAFRTGSALTDANAPKRNMGGWMLVF